MDFRPMSLKLKKNGFTNFRSAFRSLIICNLESGQFGFRL